MMIIREIRKVARRLLNVWHYSVFSNMLCYVVYHNKYKELENLNNVFLIGTTAHNNLGDHAISYSEITFLKDCFPNSNIVEITDKDSFKYVLTIRKIIKKNEFIFLHGGGNVGVEYFYHELIRRRYIKTFVDNKIVIFPQTFDYGNSIYGRLQKNISSSIYNKHKHLLFFIREKYSFEEAKKNISLDKLCLVPDIVLYLRKIDFTDGYPKKIFACLRNDNEKITPDSFVNKLKEYANDNKMNMYPIDTIYERDIKPEERLIILNRFWKMLSEGRLIITDRLHAMVFSHLLGLRCIVMPNYNYKVKGLYEWIQEDPNIVFLDDYGKVFEMIETLNNRESTFEDREYSYYKEFNIMMNRIKKMI